MSIHPTALVHDGACLGEGVTIEAFSIIGPNVVIGADTTVGSHCVITGHTTIGAHCQISHHVVLGTAPQDLKYQGEPTRLEIGDYNVIREFATINIGTATGTGLTKVGNQNLLMAYSHVAHDGRIGNQVILSNAVTLAGHVTIEDHAIVGGLTAFHQFTRMGAYAFVGGCSAVSQDVPPYCLAAGNRAKLYGINRVGLTRKGFSPETISLLKRAVNLLLNPELNTTQALTRIEAECGNHEVIIRLSGFIRSAHRGICKG